MTSSPLRIIFMGTPEFSCPTLKALAEDKKFEILAVITQPDKKIGRKQEIIASPVKILAQNYNLPLLQPEQLKDNAEIIKLLKNLQPDFIVVVAYGQILDENILNIPRFGCINIHGSLLPKLRGASPVEQALLNDEKETGLTIMQMDRKMDHGGIFLLKKLKIEEDDTALTLREKLSELGANLLPVCLVDIAEHELKPISQDHSKATYCKKITKENGKVDVLKQSARQILQMLKAFNPWPGCYMQIHEKNLKLIKFEIDENSNLKPGEFKIDQNSLYIGTLKGALIPQELQLEGKKALPIKEFLQGNKKLFEKHF